MKSLIVTCILSLSSLNGYGDNTALLNAVEASFVFEDGIRVSMKTDKLDCLDAVEITVGSNKFQISQKELGGIYHPLLYKIHFTKSGPDVWELTIQYTDKTYLATQSEISIYFGKNGYKEKLLKIATGENTWIYKKQEAGKALVDYGQGGGYPELNDSIKREGSSEPARGDKSTTAGQLFDVGLANH